MEIENVNPEDVQEVLKNQNIEQADIGDISKKAYLDYSLSVIIGRAIPDVRDGLKPVHRRIIYSMNDLGITPKSQYKKSARVAGDVIGKYHPHGDVSVYDAMVTMAQDFKTREPLCDGQGNWGNIDGDNAAAMRYCVTGDTMIKTTKGLIRIENLVKDPTIEEQDINIEVYSLGNNINKATKFFNSGQQNIIEITTKNGYKLKGSENHPVLTLQKDNNEKPYYFWKQLSKIDENDYVLIDRNEFDSKNKSKDINKAIIYACLIAEGSISEKRITFVNTDLSLMNKFLESYEKVYDKKYYLYSRILPSGKTIYEFDVQNLKSKIFNCEVFKELKNLKSKDKIIPKFIFNSNKNVQKIFLQAIFECDGSISHMKKDNFILVNYDSISLKLIEQIKLLLLNFGIYSKINFQKRDNSYKIYLGNKINTTKFLNNVGFFTIKKFKQFQYLELVKNDKKTPLNEDKIPFISNYIRNKYKNVYLNKNNIDNYFILNSNKINKIMDLIDDDDKKLYQNFINTNYFYDKISKINYLEEKEDVYSIRVDSDCHSFIGNGIVNHNTEVRLTEYGYSLLHNIEKKSVQFKPNYDDSTIEPEVLPALVPNILVNGTEGIAVGMATYMTPHNVNEVISATIAKLKKPDITIEELRKYIKGPDLPTGGILMKDSMDNIYENGEGRFYVKAKYHIEDDDRKIVITEIPFQVKKTNIILEIVNLVKEKQIFGIVDAQDESNKDGLRIVLSIKKGENIKIIMNTLFKRTSLQKSYSVKNLVIKEKQPLVMNLINILDTFIEFRKDIVTKDINFDINKLNAKAHILRGIKIALNNLDLTLALIRGSKNSQESKEKLISNLEVDEIQAQAIVDTKLQKLSNLETLSIFDELDSIEKEVERLSNIISTDENLSNFIINQLKDLNKKFKSTRKTLITDEEPFISNEELITDEDVAIIITKDGFVRKTPLDNFKSQHRGGKGKSIISLREDDYVKSVLFCKNNEYLTVFTKNSKAFSLPVYTITENLKGRLITNLIDDNSGVFDIIHTSDTKEMLFVTEKGQIVKLSGKNFTNIRKNGIKSIRINEDDKLIKVLPVNEENTHLMITTKNGITMTTLVKNFRMCGRGASGVKGMSLAKGDVIVDSTVVKLDDKILLISEQGFGKQNLVSDFRITNRGSKGVKSFKISEKTGFVVGIVKSELDKDLVVTTKKGIIIRTPLEKISTNNGRVTVGVKVINVTDNDIVMSFDIYEKMEVYED